MKKSILLVMMILGFAIQEPVYEKVDEYVRCRDVSVEIEDMYVERVYFVQEGLLVKLIEYEYIPFSYFDDEQMIEEAFYELMDEYVYRGHPHFGYSSLAPYYASDGIMNPYNVVDFSDLSLFSLDEVSNAVKTQDHKGVIFKLYFNMYEDSSNCSL